MGLFLSALIASGCGGGAEGSVVIIDAEYDPMVAATTFGPISMATPSAAQTFTVLADGKFERFRIVLSRMNPVNTGTIRITICPLVAGLPNPDLASSIIDPIDVITMRLPVDGNESYAMFDVGDDSDRQVRTGETYAIVVELLIQATGTGPIVKLLGSLGSVKDNDVDGSAAEDIGSGYVFDPTNDDYIFRTFVLQ